MCAADGGHPTSVIGGARQGLFEERTTAAAEVLVELLLEGFAHQVQRKRVKAGVGEGQDTSDDTAHKMSHGSVHLLERKCAGKKIQNILKVKQKHFFFFFFFQKKE